MISFNSELLIDLVKNKISLNQLSFGPIQIGADINVIDIMQINDIYVDNPLNGSFNFENSNYTITERLEQLQKHNGYIHLAGGLSCGVKNQKVSEFRIRKRYIDKVSNFSREEIIDFHGYPDYELIDYHPWDDGVIDYYILCYNNKNINFYIEPNGTLKEIYTGQLDKDKYTLR